MPKIKSISGMALMALLAACSAEGQQADQAGKTGNLGQSASATLPAPSHILEGRNLTIHLPYRRSEKLSWVAGNQLGDTGPFRYVASKVEPNGGGEGVDVYTVTYEASTPGSAALRFALVPTGKTLVGPKKSIFQGTPSGDYTANVTVTQ